MRINIASKQDAIIKHEKAETTDSQEYMDAVKVFYKRHLCRLDPWPIELLQSFEWMEKDHTVYMTMFVTLAIVSDRALMSVQERAVRVPCYRISEDLDYRRGGTQDQRPDAVA